MKIVITGASGYIGSRLCLFLSEKKHHITAVCSSKIPEKKVGLKKLINSSLVTSEINLQLI